LGTRSPDGLRRTSRTKLAQALVHALGDVVQRQLAQRCQVCVLEEVLGRRRSTFREIAWSKY
jgi:hypothetical protein